MCRVPHFNFVYDNIQKLTQIIEEAKKKRINKKFVLCGG